MVAVKNIKKKKAFTLLETIATIVIYAVMLLMITNIVLINARLSQQIKMRSRVRTEIAEVMSLIKRDIRNASSVTVAENGSSCRMVVSGTYILWTISNNNIEKRVSSDGISYTTQYVTGEYITVDSLTLDITAGTDPTNNKQSTIILTIKAQGTNPLWKITNQIGQEIISTRNYALEF